MSEDIVVPFRNPDTGTFIMPLKYLGRLKEEGWRFLKKQSKNDRTPYVYCWRYLGNYKQESKFLHVLLMGFEKGRLIDSRKEQVHHKDHNGLNDSLSNIELTDRHGNQRARLKTIGTLSKYKWVTKRKNMYLGQLNRGGKIVRGCYSKEEEFSAIVADVIASLLGGYSGLNFSEMPFEEKWRKIGEIQHAQIIKCLKRYNFITNQVRSMIGEVSE